MPACQRGQLHVADRRDEVGVDVVGVDAQGGRADRGAGGQPVPQPSADGSTSYRRAPRPTAGEPVPGLGRPRSASRTRLDGPALTGPTDPPPGNGSTNSRAHAHGADHTRSRPAGRSGVPAPALLIHPRDRHPGTPQLRLDLQPASPMKRERPSHRSELPANPRASSSQRGRERSRRTLSAAEKHARLRSPKSRRPST
jgi:hypothetical protein